MSPARPARRSPLWRRYVAIGDSFTEGMSDPDPQVEDRYIGWADRLADQLAERNRLAGVDFGYANLAIRGRLVADVVGAQTDAALAQEPDLVSLAGGGNDCLRPSVDLDELSDQVEGAVRRIRATGADVLLANCADPGWAPLLKHTRVRFAVHAANIWGIAQRHDCWVLDQWTFRALRHGDMWAPDRIHLSSEGHRRVAAQAAWTLGLDPEPGWRTPPPPAPAPGRAQSARGHATWARTYLSPWVQRRVQGRSSGDDLAPKFPDVQPR